MLLGDGIGPENHSGIGAVVDAAPAAAGAGGRAGSSCRWGSRRSGSTAPPAGADTWPLCAETDGWLLGPIDGVAYPEPQRSQLNPSGVLRKHFDLYANVRPRGPSGGPWCRTPTW